MVFLATFQPIGSRYGIPAVQRAAAELAGRVSRLAPPGSVVGSLSEWTTGVFVPECDPEVVIGFVDGLADANDREDLEIDEGCWAEIRAAVGIVEVAGSADDIHALLVEGGRRAEADLNRFPDEWHYPVPVS